MNADAVHSLYVENHQWLHGWLFRRLQNIDDASDLSHDTYVRIIKSGRFPEYQEQSRPFLMQVAKGLVVDLHRRRALEHAYLESLAALPDAYAVSAEETEITLRLLIRIDEALDQLPDNVRETFLLSRFEGKKYSEIAEHLNVSVGSVRKYMFKAMMSCMLVIGSKPE